MVLGRPARHVERCLDIFFMKQLTDLGYAYVGAICPLTENARPPGVSRIARRPKGFRVEIESQHYGAACAIRPFDRSEEHTSELQSLMRISYAVFCLKKKNYYNNKLTTQHIVQNN